MDIAIPLAGEMGAGLGAVLVSHGNRVLTCLDGRSEATRDRAAAAGMEAASFAEMARADIVMSVVPPGVAADIAAAIVAEVPAGGGPLFLELNAVSPDTVRRIAGAMREGVRFADGGIVGAAPKGAEGKVPRIYVSGPGAAEALSLKSQGLEMVMLEGGIGAASALKMCYGAMNKGTAALTAAILMAAEREGVGGPLFAELADSQAGRLATAQRSLPTVYSKAYRWVAEMEEIAAFLGDRAEGRIWEAIARFYDRMAADQAGDRVEIAEVDRFLARNDRL